MKPSIFRQVALDRLSSPEQLDQLVQVTNVHLWIILTASIVLVAAVGVWGVEGRLLTTAAGTGVIVRQGGVLNIVTSGSGVVMDLRVAPGSKVKANEVVATVAQPALIRQLQMLEDAREEASQNRDRSAQLDKNETLLKTNANARQRANVETQITETQERERLLKQQIAVEKQLFEKGLVTNQQVLDLEQKLVDLNDQIALANAQLKQLDADRFAIQSTPVELDVDRKARIAAIDRQIGTLKGNLELAQNVISPYEGEVLEVKVSSGSMVAEAQPIVSIQPRVQHLEVLAYVPSQLAKDVSRGMDIEISPSNVKREEYGFIRGHVTSVADYPSTEAAIMRYFENESLMKTVTAAGLVTEIHASLDVDATTASGLQWSTSKGPDFPISSGTICQVDVVTKRERPIVLVFPSFKQGGK